MMLETTDLYQNGKVFKEINFQIMIRKEKIKTCEQSIKKYYKLAGINGPKGTDGMGIDYSRVSTSTHATHIGLDDAIRISEQDKRQIYILKREIDVLRRRKNNLMRILKSLDGVEEKIFYRRIIMKETQELAAEEIGLSTRQLQRIEKQMKNTLITLDV